MQEERSTTSFSERAEAFLARFEGAVDDLADDVDIDVLRAGNVLTLAFENGHRLVVNTQEAASEIWVAARSGGFHFRWDDESARWLDTRSREDLGATLARLIEEETGFAPTLSL